MKKIYNKTAFTLFEILIYLAVFAITFTGFVGLFVLVDKNNKSAINDKALQNVSIFLTQHIQDSVFKSTRIDIPTFNGNELLLAQLPKCSNAPCSNTPSMYYDYKFSGNVINFYSAPTLAGLTTAKPLNDKAYISVVSANYDAIQSPQNAVIGIRATFTLQSHNDPAKQTSITTVYTLQ